MLDSELLTRLLYPLVRLLLVMSVGLLVANLIEALHWTRFIARVATPLVRVGHMRSVAAASFALAFFSPAASNSLLADSYTNGEITRRELIFANLFNSTPTFLVHLPTLLSLAYAFLGTYAFYYVGLTFAAALLRTSLTIIFGKLLLPSLSSDDQTRLPDDQPKKSWQEIIQGTLKRFKKRIRKLIAFTIPCYLIVYAMQAHGWFSIVEQWMSTHLGQAAWIKPEAFGIIALHLMAESGAAFSAAASLLHSSALSPEHIIMALMVGNIISSPMRAFRHQFPSYAGFFTPSLALALVIMNQLCRVASLSAMAALYYALFIP